MRACVVEDCVYFNVEKDLFSSLSCQDTQIAEDTHVFAVASHILGVPTMYAITLGIPFILHGVIGLHNTSPSRCGDRSPSLQRLLICVFPLSCKINQCYLLLSVWENKPLFSLSTLDAT